MSVVDRRAICVALAFTLVELLIAIAIISLLLALLLPAVQSVRESGRRTHCQNSVKQVATSLLLFHDTYGGFPQGGWGHEWVGVPTRAGSRQPGSWIYCILPYVEEGTLHELGAGISNTTANEPYSQRLQTPIPLFVCPSRRPCSIWAIGSQYPWVQSPKPYGNVTMVARSDYAINAGASNVFSFAGPANLMEGDDTQYWSKGAPYPKGFSGISHLRTSAGIRSITDGVSSTYLLGEKYLEPANYTTGVSTGDNESLYAGYCTDLHRFTGATENLRLARSPYITPLNDQSVPDTSMPGAVRFGSAHPEGFNMAFCDGSLHFVTFDIDPDVHLRRGHCSDQGESLERLK